MRRLAFVVAFSMLALFGITPAAFAQDQYEEQAEILEELVEEPQEPVVENVIEGEQEAAVEEQIEAQQGTELTPAQEAAIEPQVEQQSAGEQGKADEKAAGKAKAEMPKAGKAKAEKAKEMPKTGGVSVTSALLPAAGLLLVGSGVMVLAALRRR
ncbi:MAG: hypothetical protein M3P92_13070 [Actinomycetota bacterium]|nr:hypothetical protein [Actinomycetota bacterium]